MKYLVTIIILSCLSIPSFAQSKECGTRGTLAERITSCNKKYHSYPILAHFPIKKNGKIVAWGTAVYNEIRMTIEFPKPAESDGLNQDLEKYWEEAGKIIAPLNSIVQTFKDGVEFGYEKACPRRIRQEKIIEDNVFKIPNENLKNPGNFKKSTNDSKKL